MNTTLTNAQKMRGLRWSYAATSALSIYTNIVFIGPLIVMFLDHLGLQKDQVGLVLGIVPFCCVPAMFFFPLVARWGYKRSYVTLFGVRKFVMLLMVLMPLVVMEWGANGAFYFMCVLMLSFGMLRAVALTGWTPWTQELVPDQVRGRYTAINMVVFQLAALLVLAAMALYVGDEPKTRQFVTLYVIAFFVGLLSIFFYSRVPGGAPVSQQAQPGERTDFRSILDPMRDRRFMLFLIGQSICLFGIIPISIHGFGTLYLRDIINIDASKVLYFGSILAFAGLPSAFIWGWAADRFGSKPVLLLSLSLQLIYPIGLLVLPRNADTSFAATVGLAVVTGLAGPGWAVGGSRWALSTLIPAQRRASYGALNMAWMGVVQAVALPIGGWVLRLLEGRDWPDASVIRDEYTLLIVGGAILMILGIIILGQIKSDSGVPTARFAGMFFQGDAIGALQGIIGHSFGGGEMRRVSTMARLGDARSPLGVDELIDGLADPNFNVRYEAIISIARSRPNDRLTDGLIQILKGPEPDLAITAAWALGRIGDRSAVAPLRESLESDYPLMRARAARALGTLGDHRSIPSLRERMAGEDSSGLRIAYASALGALHDAPSLPDMLELMATLDDAGERLELASAVASIVGREDWFVLLARRARHNPGDALGGVLLALRRRLARVTHPSVTELVDECSTTLGRDEFDEGTRLLMQLLDMIAPRRLTGSSGLMIEEVRKRLDQFGADRIEYHMLALHALHAGMPRVPRANGTPE